MGGLRLLLLVQDGLHLGEVVPRVALSQNFLQLFLHFFLLCIQPFLSGCFFLSLFLSLLKFFFFVFSFLGVEHLVIVDHLQQLGGFPPATWHSVTRLAFLSLDHCSSTLLQNLLHVFCIFLGLLYDLGGLLPLFFKHLLCPFYLLFFLANPLF